MGQCSAEDCLGNGMAGLGRDDKPGAESVASRDALTQQFMTVLFAYLAAAYFIGATLSRRQASIFSVLYFVWQAWTIIMHSVRGVGVRITLEELKELADFAAEGTVMLKVMPTVVPIAQFTLLTAALQLASISCGMSGTKKPSNFALTEALPGLTTAPPH
jgi:hypothetical protein